jgi:chromosome segregation ATPase
MTVVVMIFLIALVTIVIRNVDLLNQLRATIEAEREAAAVAMCTELQRDSLAVRLDEMEQMVNRLTLQIMAVTEERDRVAGVLDDRESELVDIRAERDALARERAELSRIRERLAGERDRLERRVGVLERSETELTASRDALEEERMSLEERYAALQRALTDMELAFVERDSELAQLRSEAQAERRELTLLQTEHLDLQERYDRLVRPARSTAGRYVVEVRYFRAGEADRIQIRRPGQAEFEDVSREALEAELATLRDEREEGLYTRIVIPEDSGLSYNEAWRFTNEILSRYDYYYQ